MLPMKRIITFIIAIIAFNNMQAQNFTSKVKKGFKDAIEAIDQDITPTGSHELWDLYIGPKLGVSVSDFRNVGDNMKFAVTGGGFIEVFVRPDMAVDIEVTYARQGANKAQLRNTSGEDRIYDFQLDYINSDYLCRWYPKEKIPLSIYSGMHLAWLVNARMKVNGRSSKIYDDLRHGDFAIPVGVSYEWKQWRADFRYNFSFLHIADKAGAKAVLNNATNNMLNLTIGYKILLW